MEDLMYDMHALGANAAKDKRKRYAKQKYKESVKKEEEKFQVLFSKLKQE